MLESEHIRALPADVKRKSILVALDAAGVKLQEIIEDAVQRDRALDTYERVLEKNLEDLRRAKDLENQRLEEEINQRLSELRARIAENNREVSREQENLSAWRTGKTGGRRKDRAGGGLLRHRESDHRRARTTKEAPSMYARLARLLRAWMGFFISMAEDPEVMLQDAIEEMRTTMPKLNSRPRGHPCDGHPAGGGARPARAPRTATSRLRFRRRCGTARRRRAPWRRRMPSSFSRSASISTAPKSSWLPLRRRMKPPNCRWTRSRPSSRPRSKPARKPEGTPEGPGHAQRRRRHRGAAVLRGGVHGRQVPGADQAGGRRIEGGGGDRDRIDRHASRSSASARRARSRRRASCSSSRSRWASSSRRPAASESPRRRASVREPEKRRRAPSRSAWALSRKQWRRRAKISVRTARS